jgi:phage terminase large subunit
VTSPTPILDDWADIAGEITDDDLATLDEAEKSALLGFLQRKLTEWSFASPSMRNERALLAEALIPHVDWLLFGGAAGGGKSEYGLKHAYELSRDIPGHATLVLRTSRPELRRSLVMRSIARFRQIGLTGKAKLRSQENVLAWHFENGSTLEWGYCARDGDESQYLSAEYDFVWFDEATQFTSEQILAIVARLRTTHDKARLGARPHALFTTNPGERSHSWFYDKFVRSTDYGRWIIVYNVENGMDTPVVARVIECPQTPEEAADLDIGEVGDDEIVVAFIQSKATDNPFIAKSYRKYLSALPETERKQKRDGDWDVYGGMFFYEWSRDIHVIPPFEIPSSWQRGRGIDYGSTAPFSCHWGAWDNDGNLYIYRELYEAGMVPSEQARRVIDLSRFEDERGNIRTERYVHTVADPSVFTNTGAGDPIASQWARNGLHVVRANNDRISGWATFREYLRVSADTGRPRLYVFDSCPNLARTIPMMQRDKNRPEDLDTKLEDLGVDSTRYLMMIRPRGVAKPRPHDSPGQQGAMERVLRNLARTGRRR